LLRRALTTPSTSNASYLPDQIMNLSTTPRTPAVQGDHALPSADMLSIQSAGIALDTLPLRIPVRVLSVRAPVDQPHWADWLAQIGFLPDERVQVLTRSAPGGDPLVVRVANSTFALRRAEAACVQVDIDTRDAAS
jgi:ferrous iron transport protein A